MASSRRTPEEALAIEELVAEYVARRESGEELTPAGFASQHARIEEPLRQALEALAETEALFPDRSESLPERIGPYRVIEQLGRGGMGRVFRVEDEREPGEQYALKWMNPIALLNPRSRERFAREAQVLCTPDVPGIVRVREVGPEGEQPYVVMELVEGESLAERLERARVGDASQVLPGEETGPRRASAWVAELARTIEALHQCGVQHRDLKPGNVLLRESGSPVVVDFGLAAVEDAATLTNTGDLLGTPHYMAPEQALGRGTDARTDVYAIGAILYELLTLHPPHAGSDHAAVLEAIKSEPIAPVRKRRPDVPRTLERVLERALAFRREERYPSAAALADDLEAVAAGRPVGARVNWAGRARDLRRTRPGLLAGVAALAVVAALVLVWRGAQPVEDPAVLLQQAMDRATLAYAAGDRDTAQAAAEQILELDPGNPTGEFLVLDGRQTDSDDPVVEALVYGNSYRREGKLRQAQDAYRRAMELAPQSPLPVILLGQVATEIGEQSDRVPELLASLEVQPRSSALYKSLGDAYFVQGDCAEAVEAFETALLHAESPTPPVLLPLSRAHLCAGDPEAALATLREAIVLAGSGELTPTLEWFVKEKGEGEGVRRVLTELLEDDEDDLDLLFALATAYDWDEKIYEASRRYTRVLELNPEHSRALMCLVHLHSGANRDTCDDCAAAFTAHPELFDPQLAEEYSLRLLDLSGRSALPVAMFLVDIGIRIGRLDSLEARLEEIRADPRSDKEASRMERALGKLRAHRERTENP